jgi:hypothetical protein
LKFAPSACPFNSIPRIDRSFTISESEVALFKLRSNWIAISEVAFLDRLKGMVILKGNLTTGGKRKPSRIKSRKDRASPSRSELNAS